MITTGLIKSVLVSYAMAFFVIQQLSKLARLARKKRLMKQLINEVDVSVQTDGFSLSDADMDFCSRAAAVRSKMATRVEEAK